MIENPGKTSAPSSSMIDAGTVGGAVGLGGLVAVDCGGGAAVGGAKVEIGELVAIGAGFGVDRHAARANAKSITGQRSG